MCDADMGDGSVSEVSAEESTAPAVDYGVLAGDTADAVTGPKDRAPDLGAVQNALRRRADGESYAAIGRDLAAGLGLSGTAAAKVVSLWCRTAATLNPDYDAGGKVRRKNPVAKTEAPIAFRPRPGTRAMLAKRAGRRPLSAVVEVAVDLYLGRKHEEVAPGLADAVAPELARVADRLGEIEFQEAGIGRNLNQRQKFLNTYKQLPVKFAAETARENDLHQGVLAELAALRQELAALPEEIAAKVATAGGGG